MEKLKGTYKEIWGIGTPLLIGNIAWTSTGLTDQMFMGWLHTGAEDAQAAIGFISLFYSILFLIGFGFTRGTQILIARTVGEGNRAGVGRIIDNTIVALVSLAIVLFLAIRITAPLFLEGLVSDDNVRANCKAFLDVRIYGLVASFISVIFIAFYSGIGQTMVLTFSVGVMSLLNIVLNYGLVFGKLGLPELRIEGSGLASAISEWVAVFIMVGGTFVRQRKQLFHLFRFAKIDYPLIWTMTKTSFPLVMQSLLGTSGWFFFFTYIERMGKTDLAISNIMRQILLFVSIPTWTFGSVTNTIIGNLFGQKEFGKIKVALWRISKVSFGIALACCILMALFPRYVIAPFTPDGSQIERAIPVLYVLLGALLIMSVSNIFFNTVISIGNTSVALWIELLAIVIYCIYFRAVAELPDTSLALMWTAEWLYWFIMLVASIFVFQRRHVKLL